MSRAGKPLRVVVCGTTFGRFYLRSIKQLANEFALVGILARGSSQAVQCAREYNVPLYTSVEQLTTENVDLACVVVRSTVVGGKGTTLANDLLRKGIHVLQEQPVHHDELAQCLRSARQAACCYRLNSFYPDLELVRNFIVTARQALRQSEAVYIDAACSIHVLFPLVDILGQSLEGFRPWNFLTAANPGTTDPFSCLHGQLKGIPIHLRVQNQINPADPDNYTHLLHRIVIGTDSGSLMLTDSQGLVLWSPRLYVGHRVNGVLDTEGADPLLDLSTTELVQPFRPASFRQVFANYWPDSISHSLSRFREAILSRENDQALAQYQLTACQVWQDISQKIGPARLIDAQPPKPAALAGIQTSASKDDQRSKVKSG